MSTLEIFLPWVLILAVFVGAMWLQVWTARNYGPPRRKR